MVQHLTRRTVVIVVVLTVLIAIVGVTLALLISQRPPSTYSSFTFDASGSAYDPAQGEFVFFYLYTRGNANGNLGTKVDLQIKSGNVSIAGFPYIAVASGESSFSSNNSTMELKLVVTTTGYGLNPKSWALQGTIGNISGGNATIPVVLSAQQLSLPLENNPTLTDLSISGTIILK